MKRLLTFLITTLTINVFAQVTQNQNISDFLPRGYVIFEKVTGDLNKDGIEDCVLIIKGTNKSNIITDQNGQRLDRNRRGIIILFNQKDHYDLAAKNYDCFSSENEDGGVYYPPELSIEIKQGKLYVNYEHGRYGYWVYTFRYKNADFELIGYDGSYSRHNVIFEETSINFLTKKKQERVNTNEDAQEGDEVFKETWTSINLNRLIQLSEIKDFDELGMRNY